jgi:putative transposase
LSERRACRLLGQWRGTQRYNTIQRDEEDGVTRAIVELASQYGRYGYRRITAVLQQRVGMWDGTECSGSGGGKG